jgi:hypothetical protein
MNDVGYFEIGFWFPCNLRESVVAVKVSLKIFYFYIYSKHFVPSGLRANNVGNYWCTERAEPPVGKYINQIPANHQSLRWNSQKHQICFSSVLFHLVPQWLMINFVDFVFFYKATKEDFKPKISKAFETEY